ncbi:anthranilate synthase component I family protein [Bacillus sp. FJAT-45350]|uniref:anthranilate synthase component I family protein n=1 Tax=Bacillus sp. FJAT-45350 TaxID=2011014 RepID=UPI000BB6A3AE|nr:anthranilate synthase component I family protein [Bacillus sp. FJAT-45350]
MTNPTKRSLLVRRFSLEEIAWFERYKYLSKNEPHHVLLESGRGGQYSILGMKPFAVLKGKNNRLEVIQEEQSEVKEGELLSLMRDWMSAFDAPTINDIPPFQGGAIGFISYDLVRQIESLPEQSKDDLNTYDLYFLVFDEFFVYDHHEKEMWAMSYTLKEEEQVTKERLFTFEKEWTSTSSEWQWNYDYELEEDELQTSFSEGEFGDAVERIRNYISAGDVFQVNLSVRQAKKLQTEPLHIYEKLREFNPSPYMAYLQTPEFQIVSGSPELLVKKQGDDVSTRPIAGTRSRGKNDEEDERLAKTLIENEKERAEHVMLVDLERNDLGRVCEYGTVEVNELMVIEKYSHVMHIVSNVRGKLARGNDLYDIIKATFPGGTITGAPKVRTMEIIEELEPVRRGIYTGSIGWIGFNGDMELNIVIRTLLAQQGMAYIQAGAGVVIDSNPVAEFKESLKKARAVWKAKELSEDELRKEK